MPKTKTIEKKVERPVDDLEKVIGLDADDKLGDLELIPGETEEDAEEEEEALLDAEEVDPFKDKWEE